MKVHRAGETCRRCGTVDGTIVPAHYNGFRKFAFGGGIGLKVDNRLTADLCYDCHKIMDTPTTEGMEHSEEFMFLILKTMINR